MSLVRIRPQNCLAFSLADKERRKLEQFSLGLREQPLITVIKTLNSKTIVLIRVFGSAIYLTPYIPRAKV